MSYIPREEVLLFCNVTFSAVTMQESAMMNNRLVHKLKFLQNNNSVTLITMLSEKKAKNIY